MRIMLMGMPGVGKGTHAAALSRKLRVPQVSTGDMLRGAVSANSALGREAEGYMRRGDLVPDQVVIALVERRVGEPDCGGGFVLDGFPRTVEQARALRAAGVGLDVVLELYAPEAEIVERLTGRRIHAPSGRIYHVTRHPPRVAGRDDATGEPLVQRPDDTEDVVHKRLAEHRAMASALMAYYQEWAANGEPNAPRCIRVDGSGDVATSRARVFAALGIE
jgi:adenylate kinase